MDVIFEVALARLNVCLFPRSRIVSDCEFKDFELAVRLLDES